ncbi:MAG: xanthine dehydrogenase family protein subunit M [Chloroflexi bacterium]|nr:xanthine dehydrogenase family protein subunit M [Chloroflexota bacterium]
MKPPAFKYLAPTTVDEAVAYLAEYGYDAKPLAGGQSLIPTMNFRLAQPAVLVDLNRVQELSYIRPAEDGGVLIGAMTRHVQVERSDLVAQRLPLLHETVPFIAHPQIRNRGTYGGSISHADPAAELPAITVAHRGRVQLRSTRGSRWVPAEEFFLGLFTTALEPDEMVVEIALPALPPRTGWAFDEFSRRHGDFALVGVAAAVTLSAQGRVDEVRLVFMGVGDRPMTSAAAPAVLVGQEPSDEALEEAAQRAAQEDIDPFGDVHASAAFRRHLASVLAKRVLTRAVERAQAR